MNSSARRLLQRVLWAALLFFTSGGLVTKGAGVTIITHGAEPFHDYPAWLDDMGAAIAVRAGPSTSIYNFDVGYLPDGSFGAYFNYETGPPISLSENAEVVIKLFWHKVAGLLDTTTVTDVANAVT